MGGNWKKDGDWTDQKKNQYDTSRHPIIYRINLKGFSIGVKNGKMLLEKLTKKKNTFRILLTINLRYEIR